MQSTSSASSTRRPFRSARKHKGFYAQIVRGSSYMSKIGSKASKFLRISGPGSSAHGRKKKKAPEPEPEILLTKEQLAIDIKKSYVGEIPQRKRKLPPKQTWEKVTIPIKEQDKAPPGWTSDEIDLDPDDLEAQIARCQERMETNIMVEVYEWKLKGFNKQLEKRKEIMAAEKPGLSWPVVQRLQCLERMLKSFQVDDSGKLIANVQAIMDEYRAKSLKWNEGLVTYWSNGKRLCEPRPFSWHEFDIINSSHKGHFDFWVEGLFTPRPAAVNTVVDFGPTDYSDMTTCVKLCLRIPSSGVVGYNGSTIPYFEYPFIYDTGSTIMMIWSDDVTQLVEATKTACNSTDVHAPLVGGNELTMANGVNEIYLIRSLEVNILVGGNTWLTGWTKVPAAIKPGGSTGPYLDRVDGPFIRKKLYTGAAPDLTNRLWVGNEPFIQPRALWHQINAPIAKEVMYTAADLVALGYDINLPAGR